MTSAGETCFLLVAGNDAGMLVYVGTLTKQSFHLHAGLWVTTMKLTPLLYTHTKTDTQPEK